MNNRWHFTALNAIAFCIVAAHPALAQTGNCTWTGGSGDSWHTAANWDCDQHGGVPTADDAVVIAGGAATVTLGEDAQAWSLEVGIDDGSSPHPNDHQLLTTVDNVTLTIGDGGVVVRQTGYMQPGRRQVFGIGSQSPQRANLESTGGILVHGRFWPRNATITADIVLDRPGIGGARGYLQARAWNVVHGQLHVISGFLQPVVPGGFYGTGAPHLLVVDNDLIVEDGSSVQIFADAGTITEAAIAVEGGIFDLRGLLTNTSFSNAAQMPAIIDAPVVNQGTIRSRLARPIGLAFQGPADTVHVSSGLIEIGSLEGSDTDDDAVDGFGFRIEPGRSLHNTGQIVIHRRRDAEGNVSNTDSGTIADTIEVAGAATYTLGFAGPQAVVLDIADAGTIERLYMTWHGEDHPDAALHPHIEGTKHWWSLTAATADDDPAAGELSLSLPRLTPGVPRVCRYVESPADWACLQTHMDAGHATVDDLLTLSDWALADFPDLLFFDRFEP